MKFKLSFTTKASNNLNNLKIDKGLEKRLNAVRKTLGYLENNPRHPSLNTHKYDSLNGPGGAEVFEAYAESNTPAAYRIFWCYGPEKQEIIILAITSHP